MSSSPENGVQVLKLRGEDCKLPIVDGTGVARAVIWPGIGARKRSICFVELGSGSSTIRLEHTTEAVYYVMAGSGTVVGDGTQDEWPIFEGSMVHIGSNSRYRFLAQADGLTLFGGPCPADPAMFDHLMQ